MADVGLPVNHRSVQRSGAPRGHFVTIFPNVTGITRNTGMSGCSLPRMNVVFDDDPLARLELNCSADYHEGVVGLREDTLSATAYPDVIDPTPSRTGRRRVRLWLRPAKLGVAQPDPGTSLPLVGALRRPPPRPQSGRVPLTGLNGIRPPTLNGGETQTCRATPLSARSR